MEFEAQVQTWLAFRELIELALSVVVAVVVGIIFLLICFSAATVSGNCPHLLTVFLLFSLYLSVLLCFCFVIVYNECIMQLQPF